MAYAGRYSDSNTLTTPRLIAKEGDEIEIEALLPWDDETLTMEYSLDEGETWNVAFAETPANNNTLCTLSWTAPADGVYYLRFSGRYNYIDNVRGFKYAPTVLESSNLSVANNWATLCYPAEVTLSEGVQAFTAASVEDGVLTLTEVETTVPAYEPVLLYSAEGASQALPAASYVCTEIAPVKGSADNLLVGCLHALKLNKETQYILQKQEDVVAFYRVNTAKPVTTKPYRCYLELSEPSAVKVMTFDGIFNGQDTDAISSIQSALQSGAVYDLSGRQLQKLQKGINIVNGKTILVK